MDKARAFFLLFGMIVAATLCVYQPPFSLIKAVSADEVHPSGAGPDGLSSFKFRKSLHIAGSKYEDLSEYQVKVILGESKVVPDCHLHLSGHSKPDFSDIRFVLSYGKTLLPYYLERITGQPDLRKAEFFVKVSRIPSEGINIYVYYGNPEARGASDPYATFDLYDGFGGLELNKTKWDVRLGPGGTYVITKEGLLLDAAGITSKLFKLKDGIIEYSATAETGYEARLVIRDADPSSGSDIDQMAYASGFSGAEHCIVVGNVVRANVASRIAAVTRYDYRVIANGGDITFERYSPEFAERQASATYRDAEGPKIGYIGLRTSGSGRGRSRTRFHWIRVRRLAGIEPRAIESPEAVEELTPVIF